MSAPAHRFIALISGTILSTLPIAAQDTSDLLSGPKVQVDSLPGVERTFGGDTAMVPRMGARAVPMWEFVQIIRGFENAEDPAVKLSEKQSQVLRKLLGEFREAVGTIRRVEREQAESEEAPKSAKKPDSKQAGDEPGSKRQKRSERPVKSTGNRPADPELETRPTSRRGENEPNRSGNREPNPKLQALVLDVQQAVWSELNEPQRAALSQAVEALEKKRAAEREARELAQLDDGASAPARTRGLDALDAAVNPDGTVNMEALPDRIRERLEKIPEARRAEALERLKARLASGGQNRQQPRGQDRPPPPIESVEIPDPE